MHFFRRILLLFVFAVHASGSPAKPVGTRLTVAKPPNIILITLDTTRADRMGFLGSSRGLTPNLDALATHSIVFVRAYAQAPLTTPSHAALLTGTYPQYNHVEDLGSPLAADTPYLPDLLHHRGYHTAAFVGSIILDPEDKGAPGFDRGFDFYDAGFHNPKPGEDRYHSLERRAEEVANRAMGWLSQHRETPFFIWLHFYDAHEPYDPPEPFKSHFAPEFYDGEIAYTDSVVGSILDVLQRHGLYRNAVIAIAADHGEAFGEHGEKWHGMFLYDETIHVPLLLKLPGEKFGGKRVESRVALADLAPSLLQAASIPIPASMQGQSLLDLIDTPRKTADSRKPSSSAKKPDDRAIYSETDYPHRAFGWSALHSWRAQKYLYVQGPRKELYDETTDPGAVQNVAESAKAVVSTLDGQLEDFQKKTSSAAVGGSKLDPEQQENLRALGYLSSGNANLASKDAPLVDPKDKIEFANQLHEVLFDEDQYEKSLGKLRDLVQRYPSEEAVAYLEFGKTLIHREKYEEAVTALKVSVKRVPNSSTAHYELGLALVKLGRWDAAQPEIQAAVDLMPTSAVMHYYAATIHARLKQIPEATKEFEKTLEIDPNHFQANLSYGRLLFLEGYPEAALIKLNHAATVDPDSSQAHTFLADAYQQLGQGQNAERERAAAAKLKAQAGEQAAP